MRCTYELSQGQIMTTDGRFLHETDSKKEAGKILALIDGREMIVQILKEMESSDTRAKNIMDAYRSANL